jgi:hypothetical protein
MALGAQAQRRGDTGLARNLLGGKVLAGWSPELSLLPTKVERT